MQVLAQKYAPYMEALKGLPVTKWLSLPFSFEGLFILYLFAGRYKADPRFKWFPVDLTAFFFGLSLIAGFYILWKRRFRLGRRALVLTAIYLGFAGYMACSLAWTPGSEYALKKTLLVSTLASWHLTASAFIISYHKRRLHRFLILLVLFSGWVAWESFLAYMASGGQDFVSALGGRYLGLGRVIGLGALVVLAYTLSPGPGRLAKWAAVAVFSFLGWLLVVAGGRGPLLATGVAALVPLVLGFRISKERGLTVRPYVIWITALMMLAGVTVYYFFFTWDQPAKSLYRLQVLFEPGMGDSADLRLFYYRESFRLWLQDPFWGHGVGSWPLLMGLGDVRAYPHNLFFETMSELGLIGLVLLSGLFAYGLYCLGPWSLIRKDWRRMLVLMLLIYTLVNAGVSGDLSDNRMLFMVLGLTVLPREKGVPGV